MNAKEQWFAIFGDDGAEFVKGVINSVLGVALGLVLILGSIRIISLLIKLKLIEDEDKLIIEKRAIKRNAIGFGIGGLSTALMILILNVIPRPKGDISPSSWFDAYGDSKGEVQRIFNWVIAAMTGVAIVIFLITTPYKIIQWMLSDEEKSKNDLKKIKRNVIIIVVILVIILIIQIVLNAIDNPAKI